jgi:Mrp family chromosome partitioning ATPase
VDADAGELTMLLLPDDGSADGFAQVLADQCAAVDCIRRSPWNTEVAVLGSSPLPGRSVTGAAYANAMRRLLAEVGGSYDLVLVDSPPLLQVAEATELVGASDVVVVVVGAQDLVRDHDQLVDRLELIGSEVIGYVFDRAGSRSWFGGTGSRRVRARERQGAPVAPPAGLPGVPLSPALEGAAQSNGDARPSSAPQPRQ